jgi:hypothetical protein
MTSPAFGSYRVLWIGRQRPARTRHAVNEQISAEISGVRKEIRAPYAVSMLHPSNLIPHQEMPMNALRMFAFAAAVLITAFLLRVIVYTATVQQPTHGAAASEIVRRQSTQN